MPTVWVYAEIDSGKVDPTVFELLTKARSLGDVEAVCLGPGATEAAEKLGTFGAEIVYASDDAVYDDFIAQPHVHALAELIGENAPDMIIFPMTYDSRDIAGRLSARLDSTLMSNVMEIESVDKAKTAIFGGA
ncbi:MAG: electron transfer flavoprotein subunit alpha/FixB family protein, partial [Actinobacteria bacterium]|nr:electron transfer flavoprotein subunit alpha/FixB family protein [Actinomycetota bacterium]